MFWLLFQIWSLDSIVLVIVVLIQ